MSILKTASPVCPASIPLSGIAQTELNVTAGPDIFNEPADIIIVIGRKQAMKAEPPEEKKN